MNIEDRDRAERSQFARLAAALAKGAIIAASDRPQDPEGSSVEPKESPFDDSKQTSVWYNEDKEKETGL